MARRKLKVGSLFAGVGGMCMGFKNAGMKVVWANEYDAKACQTYRHNFPKTQLIEADINTIENPKELGSIDILTSGFPCQAFSIAGYRQGFDDEKGRGNLFFETARFIEELKPQAYLLENVKNLVGHDKGKTLRIIRETLTNELNYSFIPFVLNSAKYGNIPQTRERIYIIGFKDEGQISVGLNTNPRESLLPLESLQSTCSYNFEIPSEILRTVKIEDLISKKPLDELIGSFFYEPGHRYYNEMSKTITDSTTVYQWRRQYVRENKNNLCPTLTANMGTGGHNVPIILDRGKIRRLTPDECIAFQGFNKEFSFPDDMAMSHRFKQAGNSVVVPVIQRIAKNIKVALKNTKKV